MGTDIGKRIKKFREEKGYTLEEVAIKLHSTKQTIYRYEAGLIKDIPYDKIVGLCNILSVEPWEIMGWNPPASVDSASAPSTISIPFISQHISAGYGEELLSPSDIEYTQIDVLKELTHGASKNTLLAARVRGDSMVDCNIYPNDIVVFSRGLIDGDGIYVLAIDNEVLVKRLAFNPFERTIDVISENKKYVTRTVSCDSQSFRILGKVTGWFHNQPF